MWRNWIPFFKRNDQQNTVATSETQRKGKENGDSRNAGAIGDSLERHGPILDGRQLGQRGRGPGSQPRSPFTKRSSFVESENSGNDPVHSASKSRTVPTGRPLLTTPLLPKIKRVMELNDSMRQDYSVRSSSSPLRNRVGRSHSLNYGPTHPTRSTPGRLPVVRLQRRPSLHLISGGSVRSPSTVKVAPPEPSRLMGPSMFMSSSTKTSPVRAPMVDTQTVVSALRERSNRKRSTLVASADDGLTDDEFTQVSKRRRQDSVVSSTSSSISMPTMPDKLPDLSRPLDSFSPLVQLRGSPIKRPSSAARRGSLDEVCVERPMAKREKRQSNGRILSSLSSFTRSPPGSGVDEGKSSQAQAASLTSKRTRPADTVDTAATDQDRQPSKKVNGPPSSNIPNTSRGPVQTAGSVKEDSNPGNVKENPSSTTAPYTKESQTSTPRKKLLLNSADQTSTHKTDVYPALRRCAPKVQPVAVASPADLESDRRAEEALRVQAMLDYLDQDDEQDPLAKSLTAPAFTALPSATATSSTAITNTTTNTINTNTTTTPGAIVNPTTTASSLSQLLAAPLSLPSQPTSSSSSTSSGLVPKSIAPSSLGKSGIGANISGLVQSSGVNASTGLVNSKPIFSTGGFGLSTGATTSGSAMSAAVALSSLSSSTSLPSSLNSGPTAAGLSSLSASSSLPSSFNSGTSTAGLSSGIGTGLPSGLSSSTAGLSSGIGTGLPSGLSSSTAGLSSVSGIATTLSGLSSTTAASTLSSSSSTTSPSQYMFKPLFGAPPASPPSSANQDAKLQTSGGFSQGGATSTSSGGLNFPTNSTQAPQSSFSFGISAASVSTQNGLSTGNAAPGSTTTQGGAMAFGLGSGAANGLSTGGFNFGGSGNTSSVSNQPTPAAGFNFGAGNPATGISAGNTTTTSTDGFNFGVVTTASGSVPASTAPGFNFGVGTATTTAASTAHAFGFGQTGTVITSAPQSSTGVTFPASTAASFNFGAQQSVVSSTTSGFGTTTATSAAPFNFGSAVPAPSGAFSFSAQGSGLGAQSSVTSPFGQTTQLATGLGGGEPGKGLQPKNLFGAAKPNATTPVSLSSSGGFSGFSASTMPSGFGQTSTTQSGFGQISTTQPGFGQTTTASATAGSGFSFGGGSAFGQGSMPAGFGATSVTSAGVFGGASTTTATNSSGTFAFGQTASTTASGFSFGQSQPAGGAGFNFSQTSSSAPGFNFGVSATTTAAPSGFGVAPAATTTASGFAFGAQGSTAVSPASNLFSFGGASAAKPGVFGQSNSSQGAPAFGQTASTQPTGGAFGGSAFAFGSSAAQQTVAPAFGSNAAQQTTAPAFGSNAAQQTTAPAFGSNPVQQSTAPAFGSAATQQATAPAFGNNLTNKTTTPGFGAPQPAGTFGSFGGSAPSTGFNFGASSNPANPAFGSTPAQPAPAFGSTTAQPVLGAPQPSANPPAFGAPGNPSTAAPGNAFVFGAANTGQSAGFAFGGASSTGGGGAGGFNFNASAGPPQFNFGAAGPGQNMFNAGVSATASAARPRATAARNQRRRGTRR